MAKRKRGNMTPKAGVSRDLALYIKDVIDDIDAQDGFVFNRWYADMCYSGYPIDWEDVL